MSDAANAVKAALQLSNKVERTHISLQKLTGILEDHEKRLIRMETRWETAVQLNTHRHSG
ncbi:hypothetical protein ACMHYJ_12110 [Castellaniella hirudinis]|uniref:hypothetical protein n=1 Tax=Castellaniella hirudinis TaxID=1144617 RepID=UPI0039C01D16